LEEKNKKKWIYIGSGIAIASVLATGLFYANHHNWFHHSKIEEQAQAARLVSYVAAYSSDGVVTLYDVEKEKLVDSIDLKTLLPREKQKIVIVRPKGSVNNNPVKEEMYKGFVKVPVVIKKGDTAWDIQEKLTPHINPIHMFPLLKEINGDKPLHPIYPKEVRIFLKDSKDVPSSIAPKPYDNPAKTSETKEAKEIHPTFIYFKDVKHRALYAYSDVSQTIYRLTVEKGKWKVKKWINVPNLKDVVEFHVEGKHAWMILSDRMTVRILDQTNPSAEDIRKANGKIEKSIVKDSTFYYTYQNRLANMPLDTTKQKLDVEMGDRTIDLVEVKGKFYVLNSFGNQSNNSLLYKVNPKDLRVESLYEIKSDESAILSHGEDDELYIGKIEKTKGLDGKITEQPKVLSMNLKTLNTDSMDWELIYSPTMMGWSHYLYAVEDGVLKIYLSGEKKPIKTIQIQSSNFTLIP